MLQGEHSAILSAFIKLPFVVKIFVLSTFEWRFYTGFTVIHHIFEPVQEILVLVTYASSEGLDEYIQWCSHIRAFSAHTHEVGT